MGGMPFPSAQGEIDGRMNGLKSDLSIDEVSRPMKYGKFHSQYWRGFDIGYEKGQALRNDMRKLRGALSFEEYIECCEFLFSKTQYCRTSPKEYLDHIEHWDQFGIDSKVCQESLKFLVEHKVQRALNEIFEFYKTNFRMKALRELDILVQDLKVLRNRKKKEKEYDASEGRAKIVMALKSMLDRYGEHEK